MLSSTNVRLNQVSINMTRGVELILFLFFFFRRV